MNPKWIQVGIAVTFLGLLVSCQGKPALTQAKPTLAPPTSVPTSLPTVAPETPTTPPTSTPAPVKLSITLGENSTSQGITLDTGGDFDTSVVQVGSPAVEARQSGNGAALASPDNNTVGDLYLQFKVDDSLLFNGSPTGHVRLEVDYFDKGKDSFTLQYDAQPTNSSDGKFAGGGTVFKTDTGTIKTADFNLCNAFFGNRDNGADFRISDNGDGADVISAVRVIGLPSGTATWRVDDYGANPLDNQPDSAAIQTVLDSACSGDTVVFSSPAGNSAYQGYLIDKTLFLTGMSAKQNLTFTSSDPTDHALLRATADLKGFVVRLYARSRFVPDRNIDNIDFGYINIDGGRDVRVCSGKDQVLNGIGDNWGSWLPECSSNGDPWCSPGNIGMDGFNSAVKVHDLLDKNTECGTALGMGGAGGTIQNVTIDTAGDHVHVAGCALTDNDGDLGGWSDGITFSGPDMKIIGNTIIDPSDVGIVDIGGTNTTISNNTVRITAGNYGAFAAIAVHSWQIGDASGIQVIGNTVVSEGDSKCGGLHAGINIGPHMWGGGCTQSVSTMAFGNPSCSVNPDVTKVIPCSGAYCQVWTMLPSGGTFTLKDNTVTGAQVNYLIEGFDILGTFIDENNISQTPRQSDWGASRSGCNGVTWGPIDKVAHNPSLPGYTDLEIHCER